MAGKLKQIMVMILASALLFSCVSRKVFSTHYYTENEKALTEIEQQFRELARHKKFSIAFTDRAFNFISLELHTDSIRYIYSFDIREQRLQDTLFKYGLPVTGMMELIYTMRSIQCIWIDDFTYYSNNQPHSLVFMSIRHIAFHLPFQNEKYYILTFFAQPQYFDSEGRLLANRQVRKLRRINDDIFRRVNDKVAYTISERFR